MNRRKCVSSAALAAAALAAKAGSDEEQVKDVTDNLESIRKEHGIPGITAAAARGKEIIAQGVAGVRRLGEESRVTVDDRFLIGSCTKRMTALAVCRLIDRGQLSFDLTLGEALPEFKMRDDYRSVTLAQLLTFTGGIQPYTLFNPRTTPIIFQLEGSADQRREQFIRHLLEEEPIVTPGTERKYSNASYMLAAYIGARKTGGGIDGLLREEVFKPLGFTKAGFGRPRTKEHPNEPWGHVKGANGFEPEQEQRPAPAEELL